MKVLLVDDDKSFTEIYEDILKSNGIEAMIKNRPDDVWDAIGRFNPDVVLLDIMMPGRDGISVCKQIKSNPECSKIKVIMLTCKDFVEDREMAKAVGADEFISKLISPDEVIKIVRMVAKAAPTAEKNRDSVLTSRYTEKNRREESKFCSPLNEKLAYIKFWGTRGSLPVADAEMLNYGGETSCVEMRFDRDVFIFDAGTGIRKLGDQLMRETGQFDNINIFLSHFHWDHLQGFPFFSPLYSKKMKIDVFGCKEAEIDVHNVLKTLMSYPFFPIPLQHIEAKIEIFSLTESFCSVGKVKISTILLNHPGYTLGFSLEWMNRKIVYIPDNEVNLHDSETNMEFEQKLIEFASEADILVHDAQYTPSEYKNKKSWGHSSYANTLGIAMKANVKKLYLFHHDPSRRDSDIDFIVEECKQLAKKNKSHIIVEAARQNEIIYIMGKTV